MSDPAVVWCLVSALLFVTAAFVLFAGDWKGAAFFAATSAYSYERMIRA